MLLPRRGPVAIPHDPELDATEDTVGARLRRYGVPALRVTDLLGEGRILIDGRPAHALGQPLDPDETVELDVAHDGELS